MCFFNTLHPVLSLRDFVRVKIVISVFARKFANNAEHWGGGGLFVKRILASEILSAI